MTEVRWKRRAHMRRAIPDVFTLRPRAEGRPPVFWLAIIFVAAVLLLVLGLGFHGLDGLLPDGEPFNPYFTT